VPATATASACVTVRSAGPPASPIDVNPGTAKAIRRRNRRRWGTAPSARRRLGSGEPHLGIARPRARCEVDTSISLALAIIVVATARAH
jgi:hypothetical protein